MATRFPSQMVHAAGAVMTLVPDVVCIEGRDDRPTVPLVRALTNQVDLVVLDDADGRGDLDRDQTRGRLNTGTKRVFVRTADGSPFPDVSELDRDALAAVAWIAPVYAADDVTGRHLVSPLPDRLIARISEVARTSPLLAELRAAGLIADDRRLRDVEGHHLLHVRDPLRHPALELRDQLAGRLGGALTLHLAYMPVFVPTALVPNDLLFPSQWNMVRIGAGGPGQTAWDLEQGGSEIVVCVLDDGCQLDHPDLTGRYASDGINLGDPTEDGHPQSDLRNHGTPCAGIVAATSGNGVGVAGTAAGCRILPVAFDYWSDDEFADGLRYAREQGARVVSMSFMSPFFDHDEIDPRLEAAFAAGLVLCAATGNDDVGNGIGYPASHPRVMACGATDQADNRKRPVATSAGGSNYGPQMSVTAPGLLCPTTDRTGTDGYTVDAYITTFGNTSAATAHVAGLAALLLSADGSLSSTQVRNAIEQTAAKVGAVAYLPGKPNGSWNEQLGYGRIDARAALELVIANRDTRRVPHRHRLLPVRLWERIGWVGLGAALAAATVRPGRRR